MIDSASADLRYWLPTDGDSGVGGGIWGECVVVPTTAKRGCCGCDAGGVGVFEGSEEAESLEFEGCSVEAVLYSAFVH